jgi:hypothetical protein
MKLKEPRLKVPSKNAFYFVVHGNFNGNKAAVLCALHLLPPAAIRTNFTGRLKSNSDVDR